MIQNQSLPYFPAKFEEIIFSVNLNLEFKKSIFGIWDDVQPTEPHWLGLKYIYLSI